MSRQLTFNGAEDKCCPELRVLLVGPFFADLQRRVDSTKLQEVEWLARVFTAAAGATRPFA